MHQKFPISNKRKIALALAAACFSAYVATQIAMLRPLRVALRAKNRELTRTAGELSRKGWPLVHDRLQAKLVELSRTRDVARTRRGELLNRVGLPFRERIMRKFETPEHFQKQVSRLDYQEEFKRLENFLVSKGIVISPEIFKLSEDTTGVENYKLVLQLWTVQTVVETALGKGLSVANCPPPLVEGVPDMSAPKIADMQALAIVPILPADHIPDPYLLRIPVRMRFAGTVGQVQEFLLAADLSEVFFTVDHIQAARPVPPEVNYRNDRVEADVECSTFYILDSESGRSMMTKPEVKVLPRGA